MIDRVARRQRQRAKRLLDAIATALHDGTFYGLVLFDYLPAALPTSMYGTCLAFGHRFVAEHLHEIDAAIARHRAGHLDADTLVEQLVGVAVEWARVECGIPFLAHERCPYPTSTTGR